MIGANRDGAAVKIHRREGRRPVPAGPLAHHQLRELQATLIRGLSGVGYTHLQIGQVFPQLSFGTIRRRAAKPVDVVEDAP